MAGRLYESADALGRRRAVVVDFDGVIAEYDRWRGPEHFGQPVRYAREALQELSEWGWDIHLWTTRLPTERLTEYLSAHGMRITTINSCAHNPPGTSGKPIADVYVDDRGWHDAGRRFSWLRVMRRLRKLYQPPLDTHIDDASCWSCCLCRFRRWWSELPPSLTDEWEAAKDLAELEENKHGNPNPP